LATCRSLPPLQELLFFHRAPASEGNLVVGYMPDQEARGREHQRREIEGSWKTYDDENGNVDVGLQRRRGS